MPRKKKEPIDNGRKKGNIVRDDKTGRFLPGNKSPGRPKGSISIVTILKQLLEQVPKGEKRTRATILASNIIRDALRGKDGKDKLVIQYIDGMPLQRTQLSGDEDQPITINLIPASILKQDDSDTE